MPAITRAQLPGNFVDGTVASMRVPQPEPQYLFAKWALGQRLRDLAIRAGARSAAQFYSSTPGLLGMSNGAQAVDPVVDELIRAADAFPGFFVTVDEPARGAGEQARFHRPVYQGGGYTKLARRVVPEKATATTGQRINMENTTIVYEEYEGPYDSASGEVRPYMLRYFDMAVRRNLEDQSSMLSAHLKRDYIKFLDTVLRDELRSCGTVTGQTTYADDVANVASFTANAGHWISMETIIKARQALSDREWAPFPNGRYVLIVPTAFNTQMISDSRYANLSKYYQGANQLFGYIGSIQNVDIFECTTLRSYVNADGAVPGDGQTVPVGATVFEALLVGPGSVGFGNSDMPEPRYSDDSDYGKAVRVIWHAVQAMGCIDSRGVQRILFQA